MYIRSFIISLALLLVFNTTVFSQEKVEYRYDIKPDIEVLAITNRTFDFVDNEYTFHNEVDTVSDLNFFIAKHLTGYDLDMQQIVYTELKDYIRIKEGNWLLFVHGDFKTMELAILRAMDISETYDINVIVFSWPSKSPDLSGTRNFKNSKSNVHKSEEDFKELIELFEKLTNNKVLHTDSISAFFHSLGNFYLENYSKQAVKSKRVFANLILNSAAVEQKGHADWIKKIKLQKQIYILSNKHDFTLNGLRIFTPAGKQLGERVKEPFSKKAIYLDFS